MAEQISKNPVGDPGPRAELRTLWYGSRRLLAIAACTGLAAACTGAVDDTGTAGPGTNPDGTPITDPGEMPPGTPPVTDPPGVTPPGVTPEGMDPNAVGPAPLRRLTIQEYNNTVRDLLGDTSQAGADFVTDDDPGFTVRRASDVSSLEAERLAEAAAAMALRAQQNLETLLPCDPGSDAASELACAEQFIAEFGARAYRRPLLPAEAERLRALYERGRGQLNMTFEAAIGHLIEGILQAPAFLYRWELGPTAPTLEGTQVRLNPYEVASRLSYFLWTSMPDDALFASASAAELADPAGLEAQVRRMLEHERARDGVSQFFEEWLELGHLADRTKDQEIYPTFNDELKASMLAETRAFVSEVVFEGEGTLRSLLTAPFSLVNEPLAAVYGVDDVNGMDLVRTELDPVERGGIFTQGAFLALTGSPQGSHPVLRGKEIYERALCKSLPAPPPDVSPPKSASEGGTTRQRFEEHAQNECASCHRVFDGFGFAFENYDGIGQYRTLDNGLPVDASGLVTLDGVEQSFTDAKGLLELMANSAEAQRCFTTQWLRFGLRRNNLPEDAVSLQAASDQFIASGGDVKEMLVALATSRAFLYRVPSVGEVVQ